MNSGPVIQAVTQQTGPTAYGFTAWLSHWQDLIGAALGAAIALVVLFLGWRLSRHGDRVRAAVLLKVHLKRIENQCEDFLCWTEANLTDQNRGDPNSLLGLVAIGGEAPTVPPTFHNAVATLGYTDGILAGWLQLVDMYTLGISSSLSPLIGIARMAFDEWINVVHGDSDAAANSIVDRIETARTFATEAKDAAQKAQSRLSLLYLVRGAWWNRTRIQLRHRWGSTLNLIRRRSWDAAGATGVPSAKDDYEELQELVQRFGGRQEESA